MLATQCLVQALTADDADLLLGHRGPRCHREGSDPGDDRAARTSGTSRACGRVRREAIRGLSMENRMTICNMTIEGGGRAGMIAPRPPSPVEGRRARPRTSTRPSPAGVSCRPTRVPRSTRGRHRRRLDLADGHLGDESRSGGRGHRRRPRALNGHRGARAALHGPRAGPRDPRDPARPRVHRLVYQLAYRRPARGGRLAGRRVADTLSDGRSGLGPGSRRRPSPRASTRSSERRLRLAQRRLFDVPGA